MKKIVKAIVLAAAAVASHSAMAELVTNGGFESGMSGWTSNSWGANNNGRGNHSGSNAMATGCTDINFSCTFQQTLNTAIGQTYDISFWLYTDGYVSGGVTYAQFANGLRVSFGGSIVETLLNFPTTNTGSSFTPGGPSTLITIHGVQATSTSTVLQFAGYHGPAGIFVDDVSVVEANDVPEPASIALAALALGALGLSRRARRQA